MIRVIELQPDGSEVSGNLKAGSVVPYVAKTPAAGRYRVTCKSDRILTVDVRDIDGNVIALDSGTRIELVTSFSPPRMYVTVSGATRNTRGPFTIKVAPA